MFKFLFDKLKRSFSKLFNNKDCYLNNLNISYTVCADPYHFYKIILTKHSKDDFLVRCHEIVDQEWKLISSDTIENFDNALSKYFSVCQEYIQIVKDEMNK